MHSHVGKCNDENPEDLRDEARRHAAVAEPLEMYRLDHQPEGAAWVQSYWPPAKAEPIDDPTSGDASGNVANRCQLGMPGRPE